MSLSYQTLAQFKAKTLIPAGDVELLTRLAWERDAGDDAAATVTAETAVAFVAQSGNLASIRIIPRDVLVANDTDYATLTLYKRTDGGANVAIASVTTKVAGGSGSWAKGIALTVPISVAAVLEDDQVTYAIAKSGAGVKVPKFKLLIVPTVTFIDKRLEINSAAIRARLLKRYDTDAIDASVALNDVPDKIIEWLDALTVRDCFMKRGFNPGSEQDGETLAAAQRARDEIKEAADAKDGLFELPLRQSASGTTGVSVGGPLGYSETSPYVWTDVELDNARSEDRAGRGTS